MLAIMINLVWSASARVPGVSLTLFLFAIFLIYEITSQLAAESKPLVGSSKNNIFGAESN